VLVAAVALAVSGCGWLTRADLRDDGTPSTGGVSAIATSFDGSRTVLVTGERLTAEDTNDHPDLYVVTTPDPTVELASGELPADTNPEDATIARGGDVIAFVSPAQLTSDDTDNRRDVYWLNPDDHAVVRVSVDDGTLLDDITGFDSPRFVADGNGLAFFGDDTANDRHLFVRDLQDETTREISIEAGWTVVQVDAEAQRLVELDADQTIRVVNTETDENLGPDCTGTTPVLGGGPTLVAIFDGGTGCPTGAARYDTETKVFTPFTIAADAQFFDLDESEGILLWRPNDGNQHFFTTSFVTGRTQLVSDTGGVSAAVPALRASLSGDGSAVAMTMGSPPAAGTAGPLGAYLHTSMPPIASNLAPATIARGGTATVTLDVDDTFQGALFPSFGPGIDVSVQSFELFEMYRAHVTLQVTVHAGAPVGARSLLLAEAHPVGPTFGGCVNCLTIT
jgi:hypothetical protein